MADAWLNAALAEQHRADVFGRFAVAPSSVLIGAGALLLPAGADLSPGATAAYLSAGALMLTAAVGTWAQSDAYDARRWYALSAGLGLAALGGGLLLSCVERDDGCSDKSVTRHLQMGVGIAAAGLFASTTLLTLLMPSPSPSALQLSVRDLSAAERETRVLEFLERRDLGRRVYGYVAAPWGMAMGAVMLANAHDAATRAGETILYVQGGILLGLSVGALLFEHFRKPDAKRLREGRAP